MSGQVQVIGAVYCTYTYDKQTSSPSHCTFPQRVIHRETLNCFHTYQVHTNARLRTYTHTLHHCKHVLRNNGKDETSFVFTVISPDRPQSWNEQGKTWADLSRSMKTDCTCASRAVREREYVCVCAGQVDPRPCSLGSRPYLCPPQLWNAAVIAG